MATSGFVLKLPGCKAAADYTAATNQYKFVYLNAARTVTVCTATTQKPIGVLQNTPFTGMPAEVIIFGETKVQGATLTPFGSILSNDANGQAAIIDPDASDEDLFWVGQAVDSSGATSGLITAVINCINPMLS